MFNKNSDGKVILAFIIVSFFCFSFITNSNIVGYFLFVMVYIIDKPKFNIIDTQKVQF